MRRLTFLFLFLRGFRDHCFTCRPLADRRFHKAACPLDPFEDWKR